MAEKLSMLEKIEKLKFLLRKEFYIKYLVLGDEMKN